ncbi:MAG: sugar ABC transporter permease [Candidatus Hydromicrobium sp.]|jgi:multiple sugar transport system permease protein
MIKGAKIKYSTTQRADVPLRQGSFLQRMFSDQYSKYYMLVPIIVYFLLIGIFPLIFSFVLSFLNWDVGAGKQIAFAGLSNYVELIRDTRFWQTLQNTIIFATAAVSLETILGFGLALLLNRNLRGQSVFRVLFILPMMATPVAVGYTWRMLYHVTNGPINHMLGLLHLPYGPWLSSSNTALMSVIITDVWQWTPFIFVILLAGLRSLPKEPYEAAAVDGASSIQTFFYITLPMISSVLVIAILLRLVEAVKIFDILFVMTAGGPGISTESSTMYAKIVGLGQFRLGYGAAIAYALLILSIIFFMILTKVFRTEKEIE